MLQGLPHSYLIFLEYLGFRFHGWAKQPGLKTVHGMVDKTLEFVLGNDHFKSIGASRTDAMVSARQAALQLFVPESLRTDEFLAVFNLNLPPDIRAASMRPVDPSFNVIQAVASKEYHYYFSFGEKIHPFAAPFLVNIPENLDLQAMQAGARLFKGSHNFRMYCSQPGEKMEFNREVLHASIEENRILEAGFFPQATYLFRVKARGFMRNQVRLMMGQLLALGRGKVSLEELEDSLVNPRPETLKNIAPASGLVLHSLEFEGEV